MWQPKCKTNTKRHKIMLKQHVKNHALFLSSRAHQEVYHVVVEWSESMAVSSITQICKTNGSAVLHKAVKSTDGVQRAGNMATLL